MPTIAHLVRLDLCQQVRMQPLVDHVLRVNQPRCGPTNALIVLMGSTVTVAVHAFHVQQVNTVMLATRRAQHVRQTVFLAKDQTNVSPVHPDW